ncbi:hypothetical protein Pan97_49040 [Bremerella volcania]|uniref:Uncharacterized protein n=1 Tax=Bremerella volcania TaxID=2527984 RepID=A0A518CF28_9BACT|nr:hypothetical protein [Bremerella volcania]QDU77825.1 hypothetical protein Pan97_49040 [Bremerella volcania]
MAKSIKSIALIFAVLIAFGVIYESSLRRITDGGIEWLRRHTNDFCEPGYRLHSEHCWHYENGETYFVYVFETTPVHQGFSPGVQILLEDDKHKELHRFNINSEHKLLNTALLQSVTPNRLELVFRVDEPSPDLYCYYWKVEGRRLVRADFMVAS